MAKVTKIQLKGIVKECLLEILSEGMGESNIAAMPSTARYNINESKSHKTNARSTEPLRPSLDHVSYQEEISNERVSEMREDINTLTSDPIMQSIFADTHANTASSQAGSKTTSMSEAVALQGDRAAKAMAQNDPIDVFGDAADKWAALAFASDKK